MALDVDSTIGVLSFGGDPFGNVTLLAFDADAQDGDELDVELFGSGGVAFSDLQTIDWGDGSQDTQAITSHVYNQTNVYSVSLAAQPDFTDIVEAFVFLNKSQSVDAGGGYATALKWDPGANDFQPAPVIAFDVDASDGDDLTIDLTLNANGPRNLRYLSGEGDDGEGTNATFTYGSSGVYTAEMVAQPDFKGLTEAILQGPIDLSTLDPSELTDLSNLRIGRSEDRKSGPTPFNTLDGSKVPSGVVEIRCDFTGGGVDIAGLPSSMERYFLLGSGSTGKWSDLNDQTTDADLNNTNIGGQINQNNVPPPLEFFNIGNTSIDFAGTDGVDGSKGIASEGNLLEYQFNRTKPHRIDIILKGCRSLLRARSRQGPSMKGDLSGNTGSNPYGPDNAPYIHSNLERLMEGNRGGIEGLPDDLSDATSLSYFWSEKQYRYNNAGGKDPAYNSGKGIDNFVDEVHAQRNTLPDTGVDVTEITYLDLDSDNDDEPIASGTMSRSSVDQILGLHGFHPNNGGNGIIDAGVTFAHHQTVQLELLNRVDSTTIELDAPLQEARYVDNGGKYALKHTQDNGSGTREVVDDNLFFSGQHVRLYDPNGSTDLLLEVDSASWSSGVVTINIKTSADENEDTSIPTGVDGYAYTGISWPPSPQATP